MAKLKIIHIINSLGGGGAEILLVNTINALPDHEHLVLYLHQPDHLRSRLPADVRTLCLEHRGWKFIFLTIRQISRIIEQEKPSLVHTHLFESSICGRLATPRHIPLITSLHSLYSIDAFKKNRKSLWAERLTLKDRHNLVGVSATVLQDYLAHVPFKGKQFVLHNFLPESNFNFSQRPSTGNLRCVAIGNLKEAKNYPFLLDMFAVLRNSNIELHIYGEGPLQQQLSDRISREGLKVRLMGKAGNIPALLNDYDVFVQASSHEGFGLTVIEAMAVGLPVLVSDIPVFREITHNLAHFFPLNNAQSAADLLLQMSADEALRNKFAHRAFEFCASEYSQEAYRSKLLAIYNDVISQN